MLRNIVMTIIGPDRPGLVQLVASRVADGGGNWLESRMCHLGGQFAGLVRIEVPTEKAVGLCAALEGLQSEGLRVAVDLGGGAASGVAGTAASLDLVGQDRPGILRAVTGVLAAHRVNVEELSSEVVSAPMGGGNLFQARARVLVPSGTTLEQVRVELEKIATDLMVDVRLRPPGGD